MPTSRNSTWFRSVAAGCLAVTIAGTGVGCAAPARQKQAVDHCAIMSDSIGLYVGNPVTQLGYRIGEVTRIADRTTDVQVDFSVVADNPLPADVKAITRSTSILADRSLELVGNYESGPKLTPGQCIPLNHSVTPKSLSEVIGSATDFVNSISPEDSSNVAGTIDGLARSLHDNGAGVNRLLSTSSALLDSPDEAISDMASVVANLSDLTTTLTEIRGPMKQILLDAVETTPDVNSAFDGGARFTDVFPELVTMVADLEKNMGDETQLTLDSVSMALRKISPHSNALADLFNPVPWWINTAANHFNKQQFTIAWRPPMYRIPTHDGLAQCGFMNTVMPGSCADVAGQPYAVDVALLQYVLMQAHR